MVVYLNLDNSNYILDQIQVFKAQPELKNLQPVQSLRIKFQIKFLADAARTALAAAFELFWNRPYSNLQLYRSMPMSQALLLTALVILAGLGSISLFFKTEGIRGLGRVVGGLSIVLTAVFINADGDYASVRFLLGALAVCGVVTMLSGLRKFSRRNLT